MNTLRIVAILAAGLLLTSVGTGAGKEEEADLDANGIKEHIKTIDSYAGRPDLKLQVAAEALQSHPEAATPALVDCFMDKARKREPRMVCADILKRNMTKVTSRHREMFLAEMRDEKEHALLRIDAAILLLEGTPQSANSVRKDIKRVAFKLCREGKYPDHIRMAVLSKFQQDQEVEEFLLDQMRAEPEQSNRDGILHNLGKRKCQALLPLIEKELASPNPKKRFSKVRMYLALGDVGGSKAAEILIRELERESELGLQNSILRALGASKADGAMPILTDYLLKQRPEHRIAALEGLRYLGDPSAIPFLEEFITRRDLTAYQRTIVRGTLEGLRKGNDAPHW